jgi:hypothetical protein
MVWVHERAIGSGMSRAGKLLSLALACWILGASAVSAAETQLLSLTGIKLHPLKSNKENTAQYVAGFDIDTWGVRVLSVCHIPPGWTISGGQGIDLGGVLSGAGGGGVAFLDASRLDELHNLFLVEVIDYQATGRGDCSDSCMPPTFSGTVEIGTYSRNYGPDRKLQLVPSNIRLTAAARCPDPL